MSLYHNHETIWITWNCQFYFAFSNNIDVTVFWWLTTVFGCVFHVAVCICWFLMNRPSISYTCHVMPMRPICLSCNRCCTDSRWFGFMLFDLCRFTNYLFIYFICRISKLFKEIQPDSVFEIIRNSTVCHNIPCCWICLFDQYVTPAEHDNTFRLSHGFVCWG